MITDSTGITLSALALILSAIAAIFAYNQKIFGDLRKADEEHRAKLAAHELYAATNFLRSTDANRLETRVITSNEKVAAGVDKVTSRVDNLTLTVAKLEESTKPLADIHRLVLELMNRKDVR